MMSNVETPVVSNVETSAAPNVETSAAPPAALNVETPAAPNVETPPAPEASLVISMMAAAAERLSREDVNPQASVFRDRDGITASAAAAAMLRLQQRVAERVNASLLTLDGPYRVFFVRIASQVVGAKTVRLFCSSLFVFCFCIAVCSQGCALVFGALVLWCFGALVLWCCRLRI
jgi:hypothetical protein